MTKADLTAQVAANTDMTKKDADKAVNAVFEALSNALANGEKVTRRKGHYLGLWHL